LRIGLNKNYLKKEKTRECNFLGCTLSGQCKSMPVYCVAEDGKFQEASPGNKWEARFGGGKSLVVPSDVEDLRPPACHKCGVRFAMVIHQYRLRYSQGLSGELTHVVVVRFKCSVCLATITVLPHFVHCCRVYDAQAILTCLSHRIRTGHYLVGKGVCPSWWLQWCWYRDFRHILGLVDPSVEIQLSQLGVRRVQATILQSNYQRLEGYPPGERNPSLHHGLRVAMPLLAG
jgi:hypothetical protein